MKVKEIIGKYSPLFRKELSSFFKQKSKQYEKDHFGITPEIIRFLQKYTLAEITQPRPALVLVGYGASGKRITKDVIKTSIFTTFITKYLAIHDDIIDLDDIKNGVPTVHVQNRKFNNSEKMGNDLAILAGDFMWSWAIDIILDSPYSEERKIGALRIISKTNELTNVGQVMDLDFVMRKFKKMRNDEVWTMYTNKAAIYCYALPLTVGAVLGGLHHKLIESLDKYARLVGSASQLRDDLEGVFGREEVTGKSNIIDLRMGVKSLLVVKAYELSDQKHKAALKNYIGKSDLTQKEADYVRDIITKVGAYSYCDRILQEKGKEALGILEKIKKDISFDSWEYLDDLVRFRLGLD